MDPQEKSTALKSLFLILIFLFSGVFSSTAAMTFFQQNNSVPAIVYKGEVVDSDSGKPISSAYLSVVGSNISTITNDDGEFSLRLPSNLTEATITTSYLGYESKTLPLEYFRGEDITVRLEESAEKLAEVNIFNATDAELLVREMLSKRAENYLDEPVLMTVFYRESIRRRRRNVSLSEAVLKVYKQPNSSYRKDDVSILKARKSTDYERLDTMALKLRGGPFNTLYLDVMKYPEFFLDRENMVEYQFDFDDPERINDRYTYVVNFDAKNHNIPWYSGKLYIDAKTNTLVRASYSLDVDNRDVAASMFVKKKPSRAKVYPISVEYEVDYRQSDGKWFYGYGNARLTFVVNWRKKLFNTRYYVNTEMAVTDWQVRPGERVKRDDSFIRPTVIMIDDVSGFADSTFWGNNNIIEPEKSIQNAIDKIQEQLQNNED